MSLAAQKAPQAIPDEGLGYRVTEWSQKTRTSRSTTWRRVRDGTLKTFRYGGILYIIGINDKAK